MAREYGAAGLLGVLTPQANTTVEPELWTLLPPGWSMVNARLVSDRPSIEERLADYAERFAETAERFANAPLSALAIGCTGTSYLIGRAREAALVQAISEVRGVPCFTAATAALAALGALGARRIALVSPYPLGLDAACRRYWESFGLAITAGAAVTAEPAGFHPIYAMQGGACLATLRSLEGADCDAILLLGTGMPTLAPLLAVARWAGPPALSPNLALAWAAVSAVTGGPADAASLAPWIDGEAWGDRFRARFPG